MNRRIGWIAAGVAAAAAVVLTLVFGKDAAVRMLESVRGAGPVAITVVFAVATLLLVPFWALAIGTGFLLGGVRGGIVAFVGNLLGATLAFFAARKLKIRRPELEAIGRYGFRLVLLTRLSPFLPSNVLNYVFGAAGVSFKAFLPATILGMLPTLIFYVHTGTTLSSLSELGGSSGGRAYLVVGVIVTAVATWYTVRVIRRALGKSSV